MSDHNSNHLNDQQLTEWLSGTPDSAAKNHVKDCAGCRAEIEKLQGALLGFQSVVTKWSGDSVTSANFQPATARPLRWQPAAIGAFAVAVLAVGVYQMNHGAAVIPSVGVTVKQAGGNDDALLIDRIDAQVYRTVPAAMEPLANMATWADSDEETQSKSTRQ